MLHNQLFKAIAACILGGVLGSASAVPVMPVPHFQCNMSYDKGVGVPVGVPVNKTATVTLTVLPGVPVPSNLQVDVYMGSKLIAQFCSARIHGSTAILRGVPVPPSVGVPVVPVCSAVFTTTKCASSYPMS